MNGVRLVIVVPCYNEQEVLPLFYNEINKVIAQMQSEYDDLEFELLFINDGSKDNTLKMLRELSASDNRVRYISFSRNFLRINLSVFIVGVFIL